MAQNSSQPFPGLSFAYPPPIQSTVSSAQAEEQRYPRPAQPPPTPNAFQHIPGLQQSSLPGINSRSYGTNDQQSPLPPAAWPPHFSTNPSMWLPFFQNGVVPPPLPGMTFPPMPPYNPPTFATPAPLPPFSPAQAPVPTSDRTQELMDSDREDGELSEGEIRSQSSAANVNDRARLEPPRSVPHALYSAPTQTGSLMDRIQKNRDDARQFIKLLNSNNIGYRTLANEQLDIELLRGLYQSLNLPSEPIPILASKTSSTAQMPQTEPPTSHVASHGTSGIETLQHKPVPTVTTSVTLPAPVKSVASPTIPGDRKDYIARLQAAKLAKQAGLGKSTQPTNISPSQDVTPAPAPKNPQPLPMATSIKPPITDEQRARNTELIKQRLAAIKAKQKLSGAVSKKPSPPSIVPPLEQRHPVIQPVAQAAQSTVNLSQSTSNMPSFPGIPGLFVSNTSGFHENAAGLSDTAKSIPQKRPAPSDAEVATPLDSQKPTSPRSGQSLRAHEDESVIIEVSADESDGSDMEIDDEQTAPKESTVPHAAFPNHRRPSGRLTDIFSRSNSTKPASPVGTPNQQNPATLAREKELENKEKQLAAMRLTLKRKLAEKREKDKAAAAAAASTAVMASSASDVRPDANTPLLTEKKSVIRAASGSPPSATSNAVEVNMDTTESNKRLRRAEIESRLPILDAEVTSNTNRMAELTREMEQLMAQNAKITKDKEALTHELESLGTGSETISNADISAKNAKEDVEERRRSRKSDGAPQNLGVLRSPIHDSQHAPNSNANTEPSQSAKENFANYRSGLPRLGPQTDELQDNVISLPHQPSIDTVPVSQDAAAMLLSQRNVSRSSDVDFEVRNSSNQTTTPFRRQRSTTPLEDDEDFYSTPADERHLANAPKSHITGLCASRSPYQQGETAMSESSEYEAEEYRPEDVNFSPDTQSKEVGMPESGTACSSQVSTEDEEAYEPPDVDQDMSDTSGEVGAFESTLQTPQIGAQHRAMETASSSSEQSNSKDSDEDNTPDPAIHNLMSLEKDLFQEANKANGIALKPQPDLTSILPTSEFMSVGNNGDGEIKFTPYASPLRMFKSYRYHPSYAHDVAGGFLSLTFSHQIDPEKPLCQYESAGGTCNDAACPDQHFQDLNITGEKLLVQLGTANPGKSPEEKQKWNDGLRAVLKELRAKSIKDPNGIATEIAKYRRQFLNDDTRVVSL